MVKIHELISYFVFVKIINIIINSIKFEFSQRKTIIKKEFNQKNNIKCEIGQNVKIWTYFVYNLWYEIYYKDKIDKNYTIFK
jgi:hypothetical protein